MQVWEILLTFIEVVSVVVAVVVAAEVMRIVE